MIEQTKEPVPDLMANLEESLTPEAIEARVATAKEAREQPVAEVPAEKRTQGPQTYVVQIEDELLLQDVGEGTSPGGGIVWSDIATVTVPPRTKRSTVVTQGLMQAGITPDPGKPAPRVRVLDEDSAHVHEPEAKQPPAEWVV